jgi:hypothetical protein
MPQELINGYFIESNIDSNSKFSYLKKMLNVFELEDELIIKYNSELAGDGAERFSRRRKFWGELLSELNHPILFQRVSPSKDHWLIAGAGISGLAYTLLITRTYIAIEFTINRASKEDNKRIYSSIESYKSEIETSFGSPLLWDVMNESKMSRIKFQLDNVNFFVDSDLETIKEFFIQNLAPFYDAFNPVVQILKVRK